MGVVARQTTLTSVASYLGIALGLVNKFLLFPNLLQSAEVGLSNFIVELSIFLSQYSLIGVPSVILKFFPVYQDKKSGHQGFLFLNLLISTAGLILFFILFWIFKEPALNYFSLKSPLIVDYYGYVLLLIASMVYQKVFIAVLRSLYKTFVPGFVNDVIIRILTTVVIFLYAIKLVNFDVFVLLYTAVNCLPMIIFVVYLYFLRQAFFFSTISDGLKKNFRKILLFGTASFLNETAMGLVMNVSAIMLAGMVGLSEVGVYTTVLYITSTIVIPGRNLIASSAPRVAELWVNFDKEKLSHLYKRVTVINSITSFLFFILIWVNFENLFSLIPDKYMIGQWALMLLGLSRLVDSLTGLNAGILVTSPKYWVDPLLNIILFVTAIWLNSIWIPLYGITGAAAATFLSYGSVNILRSVLIQLFWGLHPFSAGFFIVCAGAAFSLLVDLIIPYLGNHILDLVVRSFVVGGLFCGFFVYFNASPDINGHLRTMLRKIKMIK